MIEATRNCLCPNVETSNENVDIPALIQTGSSNVSFECKLCSKKYHNKNSLNSHYTRTHRKSKIKVKGDARDSEIDAKVDKMVISLKGGFKCFLCGKQYSRRHHVASHCESHLSYSHKCPQPQCSAKFKTRVTLKIHLAQKHKWLFKNMYVKLLWWQQLKG